MNRIRALLLLLAGACTPVWAGESPAVTVEGSNVMRFDAGKEVDSRRSDFEYPHNLSDRHAFEDRLRLDVYRGNLRVGGRFLFFRPSQEEKFRDGLTDATGIDKRYLEATVEPLTLRAGHFSELWGHGLALSSFEDRDIYFDSELDGFRAALNSEPLFITLLRGQSKDGRFVRKADVTGIRVNVRVQGQGVGLNHVCVDSGAYPDTRVSSLDWRFARGPVTVYGERAWSKTVIEPAICKGHATYAGTVVSALGWSLLAEYKDYDYGSATPFQNPALAYRETGPLLLQAREPHVLNVPDEVGYQLELSGHVVPGTFVTLHRSHASLHDRAQGGIPRPSLRQRQSPFIEHFADVEQSLPSERSVFLELGGNEESAVVWQQRRWAWLRFTTPFREGRLIELQGESLWITDRARDDQKYHDFLVGLDWDNGRGFSVAYRHEFTDDRELEKREGNNWPSVEVAISMGQGQHRLGLSYGRERGGYRCANGVCRQVQPFTGWRITLESSL
jgi:hypothetical protein